MKNGLTKSGLVVGSHLLASSGKVRFSASFTPNAMAFSATIPIAVGTAPFHSAATPSFFTMDVLVKSTDGKDAGFVCIRTLTVSNGCPV